MSFKYSRYINKVTRQPWALLPEKLEVIADLMRFRAAGKRLSDEEIAESIGDGSHPLALSGKFAAEQVDGLTRATLAAAAGSSVRADGAVAVIPVHGTIAYRADSFEASSGGTSAEWVGRLLQRAVTDDGVKAVMLDFDSPGGSVCGIPELGAQIAKAVAVKPVIAQVSACAASAAYWLASQCTEIVVTPSGEAGSIGVYMLAFDESEALAKEGIKVNAIFAGENKLEGAWWAPMSDDTRAHFQSQVDDCYRQFVAAVAKGREVTVADVKKNYGQGRVFDAKECLERGMVDRVATMDDTLARMLGTKGSSLTRAARAQAPAAEVGQPTASADAPTSNDSSVVDEHAAILAVITA